MGSPLYIKRKLLFYLSSGVSKVILNCKSEYMYCEVKKDFFNLCFEQR